MYGCRSYIIKREIREKEREGKKKNYNWSKTKNQLNKKINKITLTLE